MPGSVLPSSNSKLAPPPVEMCDMSSAKPACSTAAAESPPPMIVVAPCDVAAASARAKPIVPWAKVGISNTPMGPFQTIVRASASASA